MDSSVEFLQSVIPNSTLLSGLQILYNAAAQLKKYVQEDKTGEAKKKPFLQLDYDVGFMPGSEADYEALREEVLSEKEAKKEAELLYDIWPRTVEMTLLTALTKDVRARFEFKEGLEVADTRSELILPPALKAEIAALPEADQKKRRGELMAGFVFDGLKLFAKDNVSGRNVEGEFTVRILPLFMFPEDNAAFWPIITGIHFTKGDFTDLTDPEIEEFFDALLKGLDALAKDEGEESAAVPVRDPDKIRPAREEYFKTPGRLFDTPREIVAENKVALLPEIDVWYKINSPLNRRVAMAAAALTKYGGREAAFGMQEVTLKNMEELVYIGAPAHGQHLFDILKSFETLFTAPLPLVRVEWDPVGNGKKKRWKKRYIVLRSTLFQTYGPVFEDRKTRKRAFIDDPAYSKDKITAKPSRRLPVKVDERSPWVNVFKSFPSDKYKLAGIQFRWNTDVAQDFIMPGYALDEKGNVRLNPKFEKHSEGKRFVMLYGKWFEVARRLTEQKQGIALALLDFLVSEKTLLKGQGRILDIEITAEKVIKELGRWTEYQSAEGRKKRVLDAIAEAVIALQKEKVLLSGSTPWPIEYPEGDQRRGRRVAPFYRWKLAAEWSVNALVPEKEMKAIEAEASAEREKEESEAAQVRPDKTKDKDVQPKERFLPGFILPPVPSSEDIRKARTASGLSLRKWKRQIEIGLPKGLKGPSIYFLSEYENGKIEERSIRKLDPAILEKLKALVAEYKAEGTK